MKPPSTGEIKKALQDYAGENEVAIGGNKAQVKISPRISYRFMAGKIKFMKNITETLKNIIRSLKDFITPGMVSYEYQS